MGSLRYIYNYPFQVVQVGLWWERKHEDFTRRRAWEWAIKEDSCEHQNLENTWADCAHGGDCCEHRIFLEWRLFGAQFVEKKKVGECSRVTWIFLELLCTRWTKSKFVKWRASELGEPLSWLCTRWGLLWASDFSRMEAVWCSVCGKNEGDRMFWSHMDLVHGFGVKEEDEKV